jgi:hypothetical protein
LKLSLITTYVFGILSSEWREHTMTSIYSSDLLCSQDWLRGTIIESERDEPDNNHAYDYTGPLAQLDDQVLALLSSPCIWKSATPGNIVDFRLIWSSTFGHSKEMRGLLFEFYLNFLFKFYIWISYSNKVCKKLFICINYIIFILHKHICIAIRIRFI